MRAVVVLWYGRFHDNNGVVVLQYFVIRASTCHASASATRSTGIQQKNLVAEEVKNDRHGLDPPTACGFLLRSLHLGHLMPSAIRTGLREEDEEEPP